MSLDPLDYLDALRTSLEQSGADEELLEALLKCKDNYSHKWWHEVSELVLEALQYPLVRAVAYDLQKTVIMPIRLDISTSNYIRILYITVQSVSTTEEGGGQADEILESAMNSMVSNGYQQAVRCVQCIRALLLMSEGPSLEGKRLLDDAMEFLATLQPHEVEPVLQALLTKARCRWFELSEDFAAFYDNVFLMLSYAEKSSLLTPDEYAVIAYKTALAALLSPNVHSFGQLLTHQTLVEQLEKGSENWLLTLVQFCNVGDVSGLENFLANNGSVVANCSELASALPQLKKKVRLAALLYLIFHTRADKRVFAFEDLATRCVVSTEEVEMLLLSAMALHLVEGEVDGLNSTVKITWLQPRVVDLNDIRSLASRVKEWRQLVKETGASVATMAKEVPN